MPWKKYFGISRKCLYTWLVVIFKTITTVVKESRSKLLLVAETRKISEYFGIFFGIYSYSSNSKITGYYKKYLLVLIQPNQTYCLQNTVCSYIYIYIKLMFSSQRYIFEQLPCLYLVEKIYYYNDNQESKPIF